MEGSLTEIRRPCITGHLRLDRLTANPLTLPALPPPGNASHVPRRSAYGKNANRPTATLFASKVPVMLALLLRTFPASSSPSVSATMP